LLFEGKAVNYFSGLNLNCPVNYNPADFFISSLAVIPGKEDQCKNQIKVNNYTNYEVLAFDLTTI
jgi:hypothetical protein